MAMIGVPLKTIIMFHADSQNETINAEGYEIADGRTLTSGQQDINPGGTYVLPDLRNRFILGADITAATSYAGDATINSASGSPGPKGFSGLNATVIGVTNLPVHAHTITDPTHTHPYVVSSAYDGVGPTGFASARGYSIEWGSSGGGTPSLTSVTHFTSAASTGITATNNTGSGTALDTRPRYYGLIFMMKVKI